MKINLKLKGLFLLSSFIFFFFSCSAPAPRFERVLGTVCIVNLYDDGSEKLYDEIFDRLGQIHLEFNIRNPWSDLKRINSRAFYEPVEVRDDIFYVLQAARLISTLTDGMFDVSVEPLVSLWHINSDSPHLATQSEIEPLLPLVDYKNIVLDSEKKTVRFLKEGMMIDLGGIAKGFAADEIIKICKNNGVRRAVIDLGGYVYGKKSKNEFWNVGVKNPEFPDEPPLLHLSLPQISVVTSGVYERFFEQDHKRYHHILSPKSGFPADNNLYSVSVICENSMISDALSTAFFVLGKEKSLKILPTLKDKLKSIYSDISDISVIFIDDNHRITLSENFPYECKVLNSDWKIEDL
jgi:thiamine biosynthesis lipoprotein